MNKGVLYFVILGITVLLLCFFLCSSCGKSFSGEEISEPMQEFLDIISDSERSPVEALERFAGSPELIKHDFAYYNVSKPEVIIAENEFYKVRMRNGVTIREFDFYWENNKILEIIDHGIIR